MIKGVLREVFNILLLILVPFFVFAQKGNPSYDFPDTIIVKNRGPWHLSKDLNDLSVSGYYWESLKYEDTIMDIPSPVYVEMNESEIVDAKQIILEQAKKYRVLLINEGHNHPEHRLFTKSLLNDLYKLGYNVFMAEGIRFRNTIAERKYPIGSDGVFLSEPTYASLIRYAMKIGYQVTAYEYGTAKENSYWDDSIKLDENGSMKYISYEPRDSMIIELDGKGNVRNTILTSVREWAQAKNIYDIIKQNPQSKFIIHVGMGHLYEDGAMMGAKLHSLLQQEDLLTIDQQTLGRIPVIDSIRKDTIKPSFFYLLWDNRKEKFFHFYNGSQVDYTIFNAHVKDSLHRPSFLFNDVEGRWVRYVQKDQLQDCPCLFSAYLPKEYYEVGKNAVAVDIIYSKHNNTAPPFLLYKGEYLVVKKNRYGKYTNFNLSIK